MSHQPPHEVFLLAHPQSTIRKNLSSTCARKRKYLEQITGTNTAGMHGVKTSQNHRGRPRASVQTTFHCGLDTSAKNIDIYIDFKQY